MSGSRYTLYISDLSPYSIKAAAMLGWVGVPFDLRRIDLVTRHAVLERMTGKTMVPMLRQGQWALNDSTRIARFADERARGMLLPPDEGGEALCWLLEEFADEWVVRWFIFERWHLPENRAARVPELGASLTHGAPLLSGKVGEVAVEAIVSRLRLAGASAANQDALARSRDRTLEALEQILLTGPRFLFYDVPTVADFSLYGPLEQYRRDPVGAKRMSRYPAVCNWLGRMDAAAPPLRQAMAPHAPRGERRPIEELAPLLREFIETYWPVLVANHAIATRAERAERAEATLGDGARFAFAPSGYSLGRLEFVLEQLDVVARLHPAWLGEEGLGVGEALDEGLATLRHAAAGRELLGRFEAFARR